MVQIEIDGRAIEARDGAMVIEAADDAGIYIPRFCYHKKLSIAANCRMCLVEVEKVAKPLPACATPVTDGMKIFTRSPKAIAAQKGVMEFLLINHPLDCPICDQGGECELQDIAVGFGRDDSHYGEQKRVVKDKDLGPLIATEMTRCIHCTRCVRFGEEIAGIRELGATGRGEHMQIGTYIERSVTSEMSGNVIDLCPVGALTSKPFRFRARAWEMTTHEAVSPHDAVGSNLRVHVRRNQIMRVVPRDNESINETWISDRDRFSYEGLYSQSRLLHPMMKVQGKWQRTDWETALSHAASEIRRIVSQHGAESFGAIVSPSSTVEEAFLAQAFVRGLGSNNVDHRLRQVDVADQDIDPLFPTLGQSIKDLESNQVVLLVGSNVRKDQPIAAHRIRKAALSGGAVVALNPVDYDFHFPVAEKIISHVSAMAVELAGITKAFISRTGKKAPEGFDSLTQTISVSDAHFRIADLLISRSKGVILLGPGAINHQEYSALRAIATALAQLSDKQLGLLSDGSNGAGAYLAGAVPHRGPACQPVNKPGSSVVQMLERGLKGTLLVNVEPDVDCATPVGGSGAFTNAESVVALTAFRSDFLDSTCTVMLPIASFGETSGTLVNAEGVWQSFAAVVPAPGEARPAWKVLRVLGNMANLDGFDYVSSEEIRDLVAAFTKKQKVVPLAWRCPSALKSGPAQWCRVAETPMYAGDPLVRRAPSLQLTVDGQNVGFARLNGVMARNLGLSSEGTVSLVGAGKGISLPIVIDDRVPDYSVLVYNGLPEMQLLGNRNTAVEVIKVR